MTAARRGGWPGPRKTQVVVPFPPDQLARIEAYAQRQGIKRAEAIRRASAVGIEQLESAERTMNSAPTEGG